MQNEIPNEIKSALFNYVLRLGDDLLILGHRLSEWCGHAPILEEDVALGNIALDLLGQSSAFLQVAAEIEGKGRTEDDLAYFRDAIEFQSMQIVELPKGDFAFTIARQFLFETYYYFLTAELQKSKFQKLADISAKANKEVKYHLRHSSEWILKLGDGTEESHNKIQNAIDEIWIYTDQMFQDDEIVNQLFQNEIAPKNSELKNKWNEIVKKIFTEATLQIPQNSNSIKIKERKIHTEHLGHLLAEMQIVARSFPNAKW